LVIWEQAFAPETNGLNINISKDTARPIWFRINLQYLIGTRMVYAHGLRLDPREINLGTCHRRKSNCSLKGCGIADRNSSRAVGEVDLFTRANGALDEKAATRIEANNTFSCESHIFSYVRSSFDLNDGLDNLFIGDDFFCNDVAPLEKQRAFLGDHGLDRALSRFMCGCCRRRRSRSFT